VTLNRDFHIAVALILNEKSGLGTSLNNRTSSEAEAGRRIKGRSRYSHCFKKLSWSIIENGEKINENN
jgi:hypothetical protein